MPFLSLDPCPSRILSSPSPRMLQEDQVVCENDIQEDVDEVCVVLNTMCQCKLYELLETSVVEVCYRYG